MRFVICLSWLFAVALASTDHSDLPLAGAGGPSGGSPGCVGCPSPVIDDDPWAEARAGREAILAMHDFFQMRLGPMSWHPFSQV